MILAAPLVIPFAEAVGISIASLGMAKAADMVNDYIQENPEQSAMILKTLVPNLGIGEIFMKKDSGDEEVSEDIDVEVEEKPKKLSGKEKGMRIKEAIRRARAGRGNYSSPDAEGSAVDIRGSVIREVEDMGIADKDLKDNYDPDKPKFNYEKFFKRRRRADGGAIGIEVLFEEKKPRKNFNTGGTPYNARATTQDFANALKSVSAGTTYQQQAQAKQYARNEAANELRAARQGGDVALDNFLKSAGPNMYNRYRSTFTDSRPGTNRQGAFTGAYKMNMDSLLNDLMNKKLQPTSYAAPDPFKKQMDELDAIKAENRRLVNEYTKNNPSTINPMDPSLLGSGIAQLNTPGSTPSPPTPAYMDQTLLSQLTKLTPEQATLFDPFDQLSDLDQYNLSQAYPELQSQLRDSSYVSPYGLQGDQELFNRRYGIKDGGRVGLFMGGDPLTGQALQTYNSMKAYGFSDQEIADALSLQRASASNAETATAATAAPINIYNQLGGGGNGPDDDDDDDDGPTSNAGLKGFDAVRSAGLFALNPVGFLAAKAVKGLYDNYKNPYKNIMGGLNKGTRDAIDAQGRDSAPGRDDAGNPGGSSGSDTGAPGYCFDPKTLIQMADGSTKEIKNIQLGDQTKGGEVTGVFQFKASDEIYDYKGVTVAGSHFVKEDDKFIMVKDSPLSVKIDKIPVVYSLDTTGRRIFIKDIEFADYNGDGVAKSFLTNAGVDLTGFDTEVLRQVENRLI